MLSLVDGGAALSETVESFDTGDKAQATRIDVWALKVGYEPCAEDVVSDNFRGPQLHQIMRKQNGILRNP